MRVLIISDTHRRDGNFTGVLEKEGSFDRMIHLGDAEGSHHFLSSLAGCPADFVRGNCDIFGDLPMEKDIMLGKYRVLLTHGHGYRVSSDLARLGSEARMRGFDIVMFGHTHRPVIGERYGVKLINPGSLSYPRQEDPVPSYIVMDIDENGGAEFEIRYLG